jgi:tetraacyldisaccharide 4'-kinase
MKRPLLLPLVPLYAAGLELRELRFSRGWESIRRLHHPVISIGNLSFGGSGKTPLTIALARLLSARGFHVDVLSRGYGRQSREPMRVTPNGTAEEFGDEPLLIARETAVPVYVAAERYDAGRLAEVNASQDQHRSQLHILDDGFQHRQLHRDVDILMINREDWYDHLLPAGNLREARSAVKRASILAIPAGEAGFDAEIRRWGWTGPIWRLARRMAVPHVAGPVLTFCGIARPEQFFDGLRSAGLSMGTQITFADHHRYSARDLESLAASARRVGAVALITTEKDVVRLGGLASKFPPALPLKIALLHVEIEDEQNVIASLVESISNLHLTEVIANPHSKSRRDDTALEKTTL